MATYQIPRNVKGESRILFIFSTKALIYTGISGAVGLIFYVIISAMGMKVAAIIVTVAFALIGFVVGTFKIPEIGSLKFTTKTRRRKHRRHSH